MANVARVNQALKHLTTTAGGAAAATRLLSASMLGPNQGLRKLEMTWPNPEFIIQEEP